MNPGFAKFRSKIMNPVAYRMFLLTKLPLVYFTGIRIVALSEQSCTTTASYKWLNQNPFRSMYFAVMQMAAELSTGVLSMANIFEQHPAVSMLVVKTEGVYHKKAIGKVSFTCNDGKMVSEVIEQTKKTGERCSVKCYSVATNAEGETIAEFWITWSFKRRSN